MEEIKQEGTKETKQKLGAEKLLEAIKNVKPEDLHYLGSVDVDDDFDLDEDIPMIEVPLDMFVHYLRGAEAYDLLCRDIRSRIMHGESEIVNTDVVIALTGMTRRYLTYKRSKDHEQWLELYSERNALRKVISDLEQKIRDLQAGVPDENPQEVNESESTDHNREFDQGSESPDSANG